MSAAPEPDRRTDERDGPIRIELILPAETGFHADWENRWKAGQRPSRWPYGLDQLAWYADEVALVHVRHAHKIQRMARPVTDRLADLAAARRLRAGGGRDIGLTWDEQVAIRMVTRRRHREMYSGAIWIADRVARGQTEYNELMIGALQQMDGIHLQSRPQLAPTRTVVGPGPRLGFARFGVDADFFAARPFPDAPAVLSIGTDRDRDWDTLLAVYARVHEEMPQVRLMVQAAANVRVPRYVERLPRMAFDELRDVYARASVVAVAVRENLHFSGLTVSLEARATGRPVVMTRTVGMEDYLTPGVDVSLVDVGDVDAMAAQIVRLLRDRAVAERMGRRGRERVEADLTTAHLVADLAQFIGLERRETPGRTVTRGIV